jgi:hypothetical protein
MRRAQAILEIAGDFEAETVADDGPAAVGDLADVDEDLGASDLRLDEPETPRFVPFHEPAAMAHGPESGPPAYR